MSTPRGERPKFGVVLAQVMRNPDLSANAKALYALLTTYADREGNCFPKNATLAADLGVSSATLERALYELRDAGVISRQERYVDGRQTNSATHLTDVLMPRVITGEEDVLLTDEDLGVITGEEQNNTTKNNTTKNTSPRRATAIPNDFKPDSDLREWTRLNCPHIDAQFEWLQFRDHALATGRLQKDWNGCWRTWARRAEKQEVEKQQRAQRGKVVY